MGLVLGEIAYEGSKRGNSNGVTSGKKAYGRSNRGNSNGATLRKKAYGCHFEEEHKHNTKDSACHYWRGTLHYQTRGWKPRKRSRH